MNPHVSIITLGVADVSRTKAFYADGLGWPVAVDQGHYLAFAPAAGSSAVAVYPRAQLAADAGVSAEGDGFPGITLNYITSSDARVDEVLAEAERAGASIVNPAHREPWGGYSGHFVDPDGYVWKVVSGFYERDGESISTHDAFSEQPGADA